MEKIHSAPHLKSVPYFLLKSTQKAFSILEILCDAGKMSVSELAKRTNLRKSNVHRLLATLTYLGYVEQDPATYKYFPSLKTFEIGSAIVNRLGLQPIVHPFLEGLGKQFHETNNLAVLDRGEVIYIDKVESSESLRMDIKVGRRVPAYCTALGKVLLAHLSESEIEEFLEHQKLIPCTTRTVTSPKELRRTLAQIRAQGYAIDEEEFSEGIRCIATSIQNHNGKVIAAISIAGPSIRMNDDKLAQLKEPLINAAKEVSKKLGYQNRD